MLLNKQVQTLTYTHTSKIQVQEEKTNLFLIYIQTLFTNA